MNDLSDRSAIGEVAASRDAVTSPAFAFDTADPSAPESEVTPRYFKIPPILILLSSSLNARFRESGFHER